MNQRSPRQENPIQPEERKVKQTGKHSEEKLETNKRKGRSETTNAENDRQQYFSSLLIMMELSGLEEFEKLKEVSSTLHTHIIDKSN